MSFRWLLRDLYNAPSCVCVVEKHSYIQNKQSVNKIVQFCNCFNVLFGFNFFPFLQLFGTIMAFISHYLIELSMNRREMNINLIDS